ncbi:MAG: endonuclease/exonuclease/phosphatase family protein [Deltaproteobacteria bacterium]|nr:endonuclease/exonuclease/phosphatase family protein [Deltaproteobacteria bacterium]
MTEAVSLNHNLTPYFKDLSQAKDSKELKKHPLYQKVYPEIEAVLRGYETGSFASPAPAKPFYRAVTWNIERGIEFEGILHTLQNHPILKDADILFIPETDVGMVRSANRNVARELAEALKLYYYFVPTYLNLCKGNGTEDHFEGDNTLAIHGNAILSRYPLKDFHNIPLHNAKDKFKGKEKRLGSQQAMACTVVLPQGEMRAICAHLDAHSSKRHRRDQMRTIMNYVDRLPQLPALFGGDLNTTTYNSRSAFWMIFGFWVRVAMGVRRVIAKVYPYPDRLFEKGLFKTFGKHGFNYLDWNEDGVCTLHYHVADLKKIKNLRDLVPNWCFKFIDWACAKNEGRCSFKIDWFAAKKLSLVHETDRFPGSSIAPVSPKVVSKLQYQGRDCSDHDAIVADFRLSEAI